jgi:sec-independent protein translocase protein TatA
MFTGLLSPTHLLLILAIIVLLFGAKRLPELGRSMGQSMREFKEGLNSKEKLEEKRPEDVEQRTNTRVQQSPQEEEEEKATTHYSKGLQSPAHRQT